MKKIKYLLLIFALNTFSFQLIGQQVQISKENLIALTAAWTGERFADDAQQGVEKIIPVIIKSFF